MKGVSWALMALVATDRKAVERFLDKLNERHAARVKREVHNELETGLKNPDWRKEK